MPPMTALRVARFADEPETVLQGWPGAWHKCCDGRGFANAMRLPAGPAGAEWEWVNVSKRRVP
ncbi:hypothetical protein CSC3H3_04660 [Thalassospira marina]|uniref:GNAT family N-acetyltransferase n=1 Tax=Thalassospira marina TaxID=2048283 RepID=A0ABM6Q7H1_9PROT|nr:hypothetical protein CSC3H3_04660 [Thalassospira marina]